VKKGKSVYVIGDIAGMVIAFAVFVVPFLFMFVNSLKGRKEANLLNLSLPKIFQWDNYKEVFTAGNGILFTAFKNSIILTAGAVAVLIVICSMAGYVMQRRKDKVMTSANALVLIGLMVPPSILPTIWMMQGLHIYKTLAGMILVEVALGVPFTIMLYRGFMSSIPTELEEAGYIDGCNRIRLFTTIIFPLLKPVTSTVIILNAVTIFNDFTNPLYFLPGNKNVTIKRSQFIVNFYYKLTKMKS